MEGVEDNENNSRKTTRCRSVDGMKTREDGAKMNSKCVSNTIGSPCS
jgi:hypothetical protein